MSRVTISSGTSWEDIVGYSRAVRVGPHVFVSGTTATNEAGEVVGIGDPYIQTKQVLANIEKALGEAGAALEDVVRVRIYATNIFDWRQIARALKETFNDIRPAATMVEVRRLISSDLLVEIEVDAIVETAE